MGWPNSLCNFPPCGAAEVRGTRVVRQGRRAGVRFSVQPHVAPNGRRFLWIAGGSQTARAGQGSDVDALMEGFISVTPMRPDLTCDAATRRLSAALDEG